MQLMVRLNIFNLIRTIVKHYIGKLYWKLLVVIIVFRYEPETEIKKGD